MREVEGLLVDARDQVRTALAGIQTDTPFTLRGSFPRESIEGSLVVWEEYSNTATACPVVDRLVFQVEIYAVDRQSCQDLAQGVNDAMTGLGLRRIYASADEYRDQGAGAWYKCYRFARSVDKRTMRLVD